MTIVKPNFRRIKYLYEAIEKVKYFEEKNQPRLNYIKRKLEKKVNHEALNCRNVEKDEHNKELKVFLLALDRV